MRIASSRRSILCGCDEFRHAQYTVMSCKLNESLNISCTCWELGLLNRPTALRTDAFSAGHVPSGGATGLSKVRTSITTSSIYASHAEMLMTTMARLSAPRPYCRPRLPVRSRRCAASSSGASARTELRFVVNAFDGICLSFGERQPPPSAGSRSWDCGLSASPPASRLRASAAATRREISAAWRDFPPWPFAI